MSHTTALSRKRELKLELPGVDTNIKLPDFDTKAEDIVWVQVQDKKYPFNQEHLKKHPKLLDPDVVFLLDFEKVLPIIYGYPISCLKGDWLDEDSEKQTFLCNLEFLDITISNELILHLCSSLKKEVLESSDLVQKHIGSKGKKKIRVDQDREIATFTASYDAAFRQAGADITPNEIIRYLSIGTESLLDQIVVSDFKSKNLISSFIKSFLSNLRGEGTA